MYGDMDLISCELEMLIHERGQMLTVVGAAANFFARLDRRLLSDETVLAAMILADRLNQLSESLLDEALSVYLIGMEEDAVSAENLLQ